MTKKIIVGLFAAALLLPFASCQKKKGEAADLKDLELKIGVAKILSHPALDAVERGLVETVEGAGYKAVWDMQNANGDVNTASQIAAKFASEKPAVAVGIATPVAVALANIIKDTPIVFSTVTDPVGAGLVRTLEHGEGNVTGMSDAIPTDLHIQIFQEVAGIKTLGYIYTSSEANSISALKLVQDACAKYGIVLVEQAISNTNEVKQACQAIVSRVDGLYMTTDNTIFASLPTIMEVFNKAKKPLFGGDTTGAEGGGCFMAMGFNYYKAGIATGNLVIQILEGTPPSEIPVKFLTDPKDTDFVIDLDVAKACGITVPQKYIDMANMVFQDGQMTRK